MNWTKCESSNVAQWAVDGGDLCVLYIKAPEVVYRYQGAGVRASEIAEAESIGKFINVEIKPHFGFVREPVAKQKEYES